MSRHPSPVSLLAPVVSPAQRRLDCWHSLEVAAQRLSTAAASGASLEEPSAAVAALLDELDYERFWVFPGQATVARLRELLKNRDVLMLRELASRAVHRLSEFGEAGSVFDLLADPRHNHRVEVVGGVLGEEAGRRLTNYFRAKRGRPLV